jgi:hypothetical protein
MAESGSTSISQQDKIIRRDRTGEAKTGWTKENTKGVKVTPVIAAGKWMGSN